MIRIDSYSFSTTDVLRTFSNLGAWWDHLTTGVDAASTHAAAHRLAVQLAAMVGAAPSRGDDSIGSLRGVGEAAATYFADSTSSDACRQALGLVWHTLHDSMRALRAAGAIATEGCGAVAQINVSKGGVPKTAVHEVEVDHSGIVGDRQGNRTFHGRPWQALSFWSREVIEHFAQVGNPIAPGAAGENITLSGIDWAIVRPGVRARIGSVVVDMTAWAIPCRHNAQWFANGDFMQMSHQRGPVSRLYATVVEPGRIATGDTISLMR